MLRHTKEFYLKFFLSLVLFYFVVTYTIVNRDTIKTQVEIITEGSSYFAKTATNEILHIENEKSSIDENTHDIELKIHRIVNRIRTENELEPLLWDPMLSKLARTHSLDMANNNYFNHTNILGQNPTQRAKVLGIKTRIIAENKIYDGVGENLGFMPKGIVQDVGVLITNEDIASGMVYRWMLSKPHRDNILEEEYFFTGIGIVYDGKGNYYITQNFQ